MYTSIFGILILFLIEPVRLSDEDFVSIFLIYSLYVVPVVFLYGILTSILSELISVKAKKYPNTVSLLLHILFGAAFILPYGILFESLPFREMSIAEILVNPVTIASTTLAGTFFFIDYVLKRGVRKSPLERW